MKRLASVAILITYLSGPPVQAQIQPQAKSAQSLNRPDGSSIVWYVDHQGVRGKQGVLIIAQGSGCGSVLINENVERGKRLLRDFAVVTVEDYGVNSGDPERFDKETCSASFYSHHTISQRAADYRQVFAYLRRQPWWNGKLVLFGGSEGGAVVQELAPQLPADAVVVFSSATGLKFRDAFVQVLPPDMAAIVPAGMAQIRKDPGSSKLFLGNSYKWWADIMDRRLSDDLLLANEPILVVQGERDQSNLVASARAVRDAFQAAGRCNLTYWELAGLDHHMQGADGRPQIDAVLDRISGWLRAELANSARPQC